MNQYRLTLDVLTPSFLGLVMFLRLVDNLTNATRHLGHLTLNSRPALVLELCHLYRVLCILDAAHYELASCVVGATLALDVLDFDVFVLYLIVGPVPWAFVRCITNLELIKY